MENVPDDVRIARAVRALRDVVVGGALAALVLGGVAVAVLLLADERAVRPGLTLLGSGQLLAIVAAAAGALGLRSVLAGEVPEDARSRARGRVRALSRGVLLLCVVAGIGWAVAEPASAVATVLLALVVAQLAVVLGVLGRRL